MAGLALAGVMGSPHVTAPIIGPRRAAHFDPVREALTLNLNAEDHARIGGLFT
jgi:aryl-alcohol dehydrogenase-like predicted oxidoreductase